MFLISIYIYIPNIKDVYSQYINIWKHKSHVPNHQPFAVWSPRSGLGPGTQQRATKALPQLPVFMEAAPRSAIFTWKLKEGTYTFKQQKLRLN